MLSSCRSLSSPPSYEADALHVESSSYAHRLKLARPLRTLEEGSAERTGPATEELRPFARAVYVVEYEQGGALVRQISTVMDKINGRAFGNIQGSLRAYRLTPEASDVFSVTRILFGQQLCHERMRYDSTALR